MRFGGRTRGSNKGLTLIELLVAMSILALGGVAGLMILIQAHKSNTVARVKTAAVNAAEQRLEEIFRDAPSNVFSFNNTTFPVGDLVAPAGGNPGLVTVTGNSPPVVTVTVTWRGQGTLSPGQVTMTALRSTAPR
ncbi:prepilin-type N-terminal cleavage/methylation domain-containing protein [Candidatus Poribacteria bacterium]|nr:prepilin-type N-terminal cleavage/methylation domain-containing protein [Candidatus Poribacteria bacterium]